MIWKLNCQQSPETERQNLTQGPYGDTDKNLNIISISVPK